MVVSFKAEPGRTQWESIREWMIKSELNSYQFSCLHLTNDKKNTSDASVPPIQLSFLPVSLWISRYSLMLRTDARCALMDLQDFFNGERKRAEVFKNNEYVTVKRMWFNRVLKTIQISYLSISPTRDCWIKEKAATTVFSPTTRTTRGTRGPLDHVTLGWE